MEVLLVTNHALTTQLTGTHFSEQVPSANANVRNIVIKQPVGERNQITLHF